MNAGKADKFLLMLKKSCGELIDLMKQAENGSITPGEAAQKAKVLDKLIEEEAKKIGFDGVDQRS